MKIRDDFVGSKFTTPKGGILTVTGWETCNQKTKFIVECSICSSDKELFPEGFRIAKSHLLEGKVPCSCSSFPKLTEHQYTVLVKRKCEGLGYTFRGWNGGFKGVYTKIKLYNSATNNSWGTTNINNFINNGRKDPVQGRINIKNAATKSESAHIKDFLSTGSFLTSTIFRYLGNRQWEYDCHICSKDYYVKNGLCSGWFTASYSSIKKGYKSCRCSSRYRWSQIQRECQIIKLLPSKSSFVKWVGEYTNSLSKFEWICNNGHTCSTNIDKFVNGGRRCATCAEGFFGFYPTKSAHQDYLYVISCELPYFKVGRSFEPERRIRENQKRLNSFYGYNTYRFKQDFLYIADHYTIFNLEQILIGFDVGLYDNDRPENTYGSSELIRVEYYEDVITFCSEYIEEWWK